MVHDSHFADGKLKLGDILLIELEFKLSLEPFSDMPGRFKKYQKDLCYMGHRSEEIGLRRTLACTLGEVEVGTYCRHASRGVTGSDLHLTIWLLNREETVQGEG